MRTFTEEESALLRSYVSNPESDVFVVRNLPGMVGAVMARLSRAEGGFLDIFLDEFIRGEELNPSRARALLERILIQFGDDSVGELEGAHLYLGQISNLATKLVEDSRIGLACIEQSSRYVYYDAKDAAGRYRFYRDPAIGGSPAGGLYEAVLNHCFETYSRVLHTLEEHLRRLKPIEEAEYDIRGKGRERLADLTEERDVRAFRRTYRFDVRAKACDTARVVLPAATLTNVGIFGNGRAYEHMLTRLYSSDLAEMQVLANKIHKELDTIIPVYVRRAGRSPYHSDVAHAMRAVARRILCDLHPEPSNDETTLIEIEHGEAFDIQMVAAMLYTYADHPFEQLFKFLRNAAVSPYSKDTILEIVNAYVGDRRSRRDRPGRALEWGYPLTFEVAGNLGIYRDLHRHRMLTQMRQPFSTRLGFDMPELIEEAGLGESVRVCRDKAAENYERVRAEFGAELAQYAVLYGFKVRWLMGMNDREAMHFFELRTGPQGHPDYRRICQEMQLLSERQSPLRAALRQFVDFGDYFWSRAEAEARQRRRERALGVEGDLV